MREEKRFPVLEKDYYKNGCHCIIVFTKNGVRNGYIGIPKSNKMYGVRYDEKSPLLRRKDNHPFNGNYMGLFSFLLDEDNQTLNPSMYFSAHCGFTFSDYIDWDAGYNEKKDLWYFGFDCGHAGDKSDYQKAYEYGLIGKKSLDYYLQLDTIPNEEHRTLEYVENCLNILADELSEFEVNK